jgi:ATP-dependent Zn protease
MSFLLRATLLILCTTATSALACTDGTVPDDLAARLAISVGATTVSRDQPAAVVTTIGTIHNSSSVCADEIEIELKYLNESGKLVDVVTQPLFGIVVPPGGEVSFRVREDADKPKELYARTEARVVSAEGKSAGRSHARSTSGFMDVALSWAPMLLVIVFWVVMMRRFAGKNSPQRQSLLMLERQVATLDRIAKALEHE